MILVRPLWFVLCLLELCYSNKEDDDFCGVLFTYQHFSYLQPFSIVGDTTCCRKSTVELINESIYEPLKELLKTSFFRYYKV